MGQRVGLSKWGADQKRAVIEAMLDFGYSGTQAAAAANAGQLPGRGMDLEPFPVPTATVQDWGTTARTEKRKRAVSVNTPAKAFEDGYTAMVEAWQRKAQRAKTADEITKMSKAAHELLRLGKALNGTPATAGEPEKPVARGDFIDGLAQNGAATAENQDTSAARRQGPSPQERTAESGNGRATVDRSTSLVHPAQQGSAVPDLA